MPLLPLMRLRSCLYYVTAEKPEAPGSVPNVWGLPGAGSALAGSSRRREAPLSATMDSATGGASWDERRAVTLTPKFRWIRCGAGP
jgi:hypothetical protein